MSQAGLDEDEDIFAPSSEPLDADQFGLRQSLTAFLASAVIGMFDDFEQSSP